MKATFSLGERTFVIEGNTIEERDGDLYVDGRLAAWFNIPDDGWFIDATFRGRPKDVTYWDSMVIS
jgi:hypothetical protein